MLDRWGHDRSTQGIAPSRPVRLGGDPASPSRLIAEQGNEEERFLLRLGFSKPLVAAMKARAASNGTTIEAELLACGHVQEAAYYGALARVLGVRFVESIEPVDVNDSTTLDSQLVKPGVLRVTPPDSSALTLVVPEARDIARWVQRIRNSDTLASIMAVTTPSALRRAVWKAGERRRVDVAADSLFDDQPRLSARSVLTGGQGFLAGSLLMAFLCCFLLFPFETLDAVHICLSAAFCILILLRGLALGRSQPSKSLAPIADDQQLPVYTVLVALYREKEMVQQLSNTLMRLDWPTSRLDIKLICEADDRETIDALQGLNLPPQFEIVEVPDRAPRTKPKALNYGLAGARGRFVVIYDAEDRPERQQLREAYGRFRDAPEDVACLQAPLIISNAGDGWLSGLFALEYAGLFRRLLPYLGNRHQPMPLGGTSNHFRIDALRAVGAWDPYNVTEDADLGMRLHRFGYRVETLTHYTLEDAPTEHSVWLGQRTRWFKGWMQTWLVLMRQPVLLTRELGLRGTLMFHILVTGMLVSALGHPLILLFIAMTMWNLGFAPHATTFEIVMFVLDWFNILAAYTVFIRLGWRPMGRNERQRVGNRWLQVPAYWMLMSMAAWRAAIELYRNPFFWNKTPHVPSKSGPRSSNAEDEASTAPR
jgi:cellulose synthase/poly-beta-1,6-N-acetylglucosamine synthase-like glycosyltransferase